MVNAIIVLLLMRIITIIINFVFIASFREMQLIVLYNTEITGTQYLILLGACNFNASHQDRMNIKTDRKSINETC